MNAASEQATANPRLSGISLRIVSALALAIPALASVYFGPPWFTALMLLGAVLMGWEWTRMCAGKPAWLIAGVFYICLPCGALIWLRNDSFSGMITILWLFAIVWCADSAAYISGRAIGGPKLAPSISPKKTWAGFIGGILFASIVGGGFALFWDGSLLELALWAGIVAIASQGGDLLESAAKRHFGVKDSSQLIPGHGGILDRVDALITGTLVVALLKMTIGKSAMPWL